MPSKFKKKNSINATGRSTTDFSHIRLYHSFYDTIMAIDNKLLLCPTLKIMVEFISRFNGDNNGKISLSNREAARVIYGGTDKARKCLALLEKLNIIKCTKVGSYVGNKANLWCIIDIEKKQRSKENFILIYQSLYEHSSVQQLEPRDFTLWCGLLRKLKGNKMPDNLSLSNNEAAQITGCSIMTARKSLERLQHSGLIRIHHKSYKGNKHPTTWLLTHLPYEGNLPTHEWKQVGMMKVIGGSTHHQQENETPMRICA